MKLITFILFVFSFVYVVRFLWVPWVMLKHRLAWEEVNINPLHWKLWDWNINHFKKDK